MTISRLTRFGARFMLSVVVATVFVGGIPTAWGVPIPIEDYASDQEISVPYTLPSESVAGQDSASDETPVETSAPGSEAPDPSTNPDTQEPVTPSETDSSDVTDEGSPSAPESPDLPEATPIVTPDDTVTPTEGSESTPSDPASVDSLDDALGGDEAGIMPMAVGPDGGTAPYVYWDVKDTDGNLVPGATFSFERRGNTSWTGTRNVTDCISSGCTVVDRDFDAGEYLVKWINSDNPGANPSGTAASNVVQAGSRYRIQPTAAPAGYEWVSDTSWVDSNSLTWVGTDDGRTLNFGTFQVRKLQTLPLCTAGYVYGISSGGQLQQIAPGGAVTNIGAPAPGVSSFNGLGIGSGGDPVYGYERTNSSQTVTMFRYDTTAGTWTNTQHTYDTTLANNGGYSGSLVAGAVNLATDRYMFGGYQTTNNGWSANPRYTQVFKIWEYNPATGAFTYKGYVPTYSGQSEPGATNGDMAFDAAGTLYFVRGSGTSTTVFSVTAANINAANGGQITASDSQTFTTQNNVNGVAFDSTGKAFLGTGNTVWSYNMPDWSGGAEVAGTSSGYSGTDLASCSSPPTIVIEKEIIGGRVNTGDQFKLTLHQGSTLLGQAIATSPATGLQEQRVGPLPTVRNVALNFAEYGANGANLGNYASAYQCTVTHTDGTVESLQQVNGTSGSITIPTSGDAVRCVFRNSPLVASVTINKQVTDAFGLNPQPDAGWTVGASTTATTGTATQTPTATTQTTNTSGNASWNVTFGAYAHRATVTVSENATSKPGYAFLSGQCVVTGLDGSTATTTLTVPDATGLTGIKPGDRVNCTYVNKPIPGSLAITKAFDSSVPSGSGTGTVFNGAYFCELPAGTEVASGTWTRAGTGNATLTPASGSPAASAIPAGAVCSATETQPSGSHGLPNGSWVWDEPEVSGAVTIVANETGTIIVTNKTTRVLGSVIWSKVDDSDALLSGSEWTLQGPDAGGAPITITDCTATPCAGPDEDPVAGQFKIEGLEWGDYTLTETKAPGGFYKIQDPIIFTIGAEPDLIHHVVGPVENTRITGPVLPLTGGLSRDAFFIGGLSLLVLGMAAGATAQVRRRKEVA